MCMRTQKFIEESSVAGIISLLFEWHINHSVSLCMIMHMKFLVYLFTGQIYRHLLQLVEEIL